MSLPGIEKGPVEGLYYVPIVYPIVVAFAIIVGVILLVYVSIKFPYAQPQPVDDVVVVEKGE